MKTIIELLEKERNGERLTKVEQQILDNYLRTKEVRHSTSFTYHSRKLPVEGDYDKRTH